MKYVYHVNPCRVAKLVTTNIFEENRLQQIAGDYGVSTELIKNFILDVAKKIVTCEYEFNDVGGNNLSGIFETKYQVTNTTSKAIANVFFNRVLELVQVYLIFGYNEDNISPSTIKVAFTKNNRLEVSLRYPKPEDDHTFPELESMYMYGSNTAYVEPEPEPESGNDNGGGDDNSGNEDDPDEEDDDGDENNDEDEDDPDEEDEDEDEDEDPPVQ